MKWVKMLCKLHAPPWTEGAVVAVVSEFPFNLLSLVEKLAGRRADCPESGSTARKEGNRLLLHRPPSWIVSASIRRLCKEGNPALAGACKGYKGIQTPDLVSRPICMAPYNNTFYIPSFSETTFQSQRLNLGVFRSLLLRFSEHLFGWLDNRWLICHWFSLISISFNARNTPYSL